MPPVNFSNRPPPVAVGRAAENERFRNDAAERKLGSPRRFRFQIGREETESPRSPQLKFASHYEPKYTFAVEDLNDVMSPRTKNDATQRNIDVVLANLPQTANRHMVTITNRCRKS